MSGEYPKIETLYNRDEAFKITPSAGVRKPEFGLIPYWHFTEKVDGTNVRVTLDPGYVNTGPDPSPAEPSIIFGGRTDAAQMPTFLLEYLQRTFDVQSMWEVFHAEDTPDDALNPFIVTLYGEGYGPKIQKAGGAYRKDVSFRLFDVKVGRKWLDWTNVIDVASKLGIATAPVLEDHAGVQFAKHYCRSKKQSTVALIDGGDPNYVAEGVVARTVPYLYDWRGNRIMWKLKARDFD